MGIETAGFNPTTAPAPVVTDGPEAAPAAELSGAEKLEAGLQYMAGLGLSEQVAAIQLVAPADCGPKALTKTVAEMLGAPGHSHVKASVERIVARAIKEGKDPNEAVTNGLEAFMDRDKDDNIIRVDLPELKKN